MKICCKRLLLITLILFTCVGCDQVSKIGAHAFLADSETFSYLGDVFRLQYAENRGGFLSLGAAFPEGLRFWLLVVITGGFMSGMLAYSLFKPTLRPSRVAALSFVIGGGAGNLIDRIYHHGAVIDFMNIGIGTLRTGIFNLADLVILIGAGLFLFLSYKDNGAKDRYQAFQ